MIIQSMLPVFPSPESCQDQNDIPVCLVQMRKGHVPALIAARRGERFRVCWQIHRQYDTLLISRNTHHILVYIYNYIYIYTHAYINRVEHAKTQTILILPGNSMGFWHSRLKTSSLLAEGSGCRVWIFPEKPCFWAIFGGVRPPFWAFLVLQRKATFCRVHVETCYPPVN